MYYYMMVNIFPLLYLSTFDWLLRLFFNVFFGQLNMFLFVHKLLNLCNQNFGVRQQRNTQVPSPPESAAVKI